MFKFHSVWDLVVSFVDFQGKHGSGLLGYRFLAHKLYGFGFVGEGFEALRLMDKILHDP